MRALRRIARLRARTAPCGLDGRSNVALSAFPRRQTVFSSTSQLGLGFAGAAFFAGFGWRTGLLTGCAWRFGLVFGFGSFGVAAGFSFGVSHASSALPLK